VDESAAAQLVEDSDDVLFSRIQNSAHHVLHELLPHPNTHDCELRPGAITCHYLLIGTSVTSFPETLYWAAGLVHSGIYDRKGTLNRSLVDILHASVCYFELIGARN